MSGLCSPYSFLSCGCCELLNARRFRPTIDPDVAAWSRLSPRFLCREVHPNFSADLSNLLLPLLSSSFGARPQLRSHSPWHPHAYSSKAYLLPLRRRSLETTLQSSNPSQTPNFFLTVELDMWGTRRQKMQRKQSSTSISLSFGRQEYGLRLPVLQVHRLSS